MKSLTNIFFIFSIVLLFIISFRNPKINENFDTNVNNTSVKPDKTVRQLIKKSKKNDVLHTKLKPDRDINDMFKYANIVEEPAKEQSVSKSRSEIMTMKNSDIVPSHCENKTKRFIFPMEIITRE